MTLRRRALFAVLAAVLVVATGIVAFRWWPASAPTAPQPARTADHSGHDTPRAEVTLDTRRQQLIGVRTVPVRRTSLASEIRAAGTVTYDETRQAEINTRVDGWIRELFADFTGRPIRRGEALFTLYSPDLIATQNEYLLALRGQSHATHSAAADVQQFSDRLVSAARDRLLRLDMTAQEIESVRTSGQPLETITFRAPGNGVIVEKMALPGMKVMAGQTLFKVADLSTIWVEAEVYERDLGAVRVGTRATVSVQAYPDRSFAGRVTYVSPIVTQETRTVRTRVTLSNAAGLLKPNMVATVELRGREGDGLAVPADAVIETGTQQVVFVAEGEGRFTPREVKTGRRTVSDVEILSGVAEGEQVAASATFFLDSESQLRGALLNYQAPPDPHAAHQSAAPALDIAFRTEPDPPKTGETTFVVTIKDRNGNAVPNLDVTVGLVMAAMPSMNMPAMKSGATLRHDRDGVYRGAAPVTTAGRWEVTVTAARGGQTLATRQFGLVAR